MKPLMLNISVKIPYRNGTTDHQIFFRIYQGQITHEREISEWQLLDTTYNF